VWIENDLDTVLDPAFLPVATSPVFPPVPLSAPRWERDWYHYLITMNDPAGVARYVQALGIQLPKMNPAEIDTWIEAWDAQIDEAAEDDEMKPFSMSDHQFAISQMRSYIPARTAYLNQWLGCWSGGGADADGDGIDMCHDCNDANPGVHPGAAEVCDQVDNDCDGRVDNVVGQSCGSALTADQTRRAAFWGRVLNVKHR
jgi:hypothetical protein